MIGAVITMACIVVSALPCDVVTVAGAVANNISGAVTNIELITLLTDPL